MLTAIAFPVDEDHRTKITTYMQPDEEVNLVNSQQYLHSERFRVKVKMHVSNYG